MSIPERVKERELVSFCREMGLNTGIHFEELESIIETTEDVAKKKFLFIGAARHGVQSLVEKTLNPQLHNSIIARLRDRFIGRPIGNEWLSGKELGQAFDAALESGQMAILRTFLRSPLFFQKERNPIAWFYLVSGIRTAIEHGQKEIVDLFLSHIKEKSSPRAFLLQLGEYYCLFESVLRNGHLDLATLLLKERDVFALENEHRIKEIAHRYGYQVVS